MASGRITLFTNWLLGPEQAEVVTVQLKNSTFALNKTRAQARVLNTYRTIDAILLCDKTQTIKSFPSSRCLQAKF